MFFLRNVYFNKHFIKIRHIKYWTCQVNQFYHTFGLIVERNQWAVQCRHRKLTSSVVITRETAIHAVSGTSQERDLINLKRKQLTSFVPIDISNKMSTFTHNTVCYSHSSSASRRS